MVFCISGFLRQAYLGRTIYGTIVAGFLNGSVVPPRANRKVDALRFAPRQPEAKDSGTVGDTIGFHSRDFNDGLEQHAIKASIGKEYLAPVGTGNRKHALASSGQIQSAHFEHIGKIGVKLDLQLDIK